MCSSSAATACEGVPDAASQTLATENALAVGVDGGFREISRSAARASALR